MQEQCYGHMPHNFQHVIKTLFSAGIGDSAQVLYIYCTQCGDVIEISTPEDESE